MAHRGKRSQRPPMQFRAMANAELHRRVKVAAKAAHMSISGWLLQAAEEKLAAGVRTRLHPGRPFHDDSEAA